MRWIVTHAFWRKPIAVVEDWEEELDTKLRRDVRFRRFVPSGLSAAAVIAVVAGLLLPFAFAAGQWLLENALGQQPRMSLRYDEKLEQQMIDLYEQMDAWLARVELYSPDKPGEVGDPAASYESNQDSYVKFQSKLTVLSTRMAAYAEGRSFISDIPASMAKTLERESTLHREERFLSKANFSSMRAENQIKFDQLLTLEATMKKYETDKKQSEAAQNAFKEWISKMVAH
jgi:hypothetical protein